MTLAFALIALLWFAFTATRLYDIAQVSRLPEAEVRANDDDRPSVSIVVAARDEAERIGDSVRGFLQQQDVDLEVIAVDDRSTDGTQAILESVAAADPRLRLRRIDRLPDGWLGKPHACGRAAASVRGDWILFTDADVWMGPDVVRRAIDAAIEQRADHVCLLPGETRTTLLGRASLLGFSMGFALFASRANRDRTGGAVGVGAFNLVRTEAYRAIGGHEALRMEVVDDVKLGALLRRAGYRTRCFGGLHDIEVDWAGSAPALVRALEKNYFALLEFRMGRAVASALSMLFLFSVSLAAPLAGTVAGWAAFAGLLSTWLPAGWLAWRSGFGFAAGLLAPFMLPLIPIALLNSTWVTLRRGGIDWRGTFYPLAELRRGVVRL